jgi:hypothetical protein
MGDAPSGSDGAILLDLNARNAARLNSLNRP